MWLKLESATICIRHYRSLPSVLMCYFAISTLELILMMFFYFDGMKSTASFLITTQLVIQY